MIRSIAPVAVVILVASGSLAACKKAAPPAPFSDNFEREALGDKYKKSGGSWRVVNGALSSVGDKNQPLFLDVTLATNTKVEFTAWSNSDAVDTKIEIFTDGVRHESGYVIILGGWKNTLSGISRRDEHEKNRVMVQRAWEKGKKYKWLVQRTDGHTVEFFVDGEKIAAYDDKDPLVGDKNNKLGFTSWQSEVYYDDLVITPLP